MEKIRSENEGIYTNHIVLHMKSLKKREKAQGSSKEILVSYSILMTDGGGINCSHSNQFCDQQSLISVFIFLSFYLYLALIIKQLYNCTFKNISEKHFTQSLVLMRIQKLKGLS